MHFASMMRRCIQGLLLLCFIDWVQAQSLTCSSCKANEYLADDVCNPCPANSQTTNYPPEQISENDCLCNAGYTLNNDYTIASSAAEKCLPCAIGEYKIDHSNAACLHCTDLKQHSSTISIGSSSEDECVCVVGFTLDTSGSGDTCVQCERDTYKDEKGDTACAPCGDSAFSAAGADDFAQCYCNAGYTHALPGGGGDLTTAGDECSACAAGKYRDEGMLFDTAEAESAQNAEYNYLCEDCPEDTYNANEGSISHSACLPCSEDSTTDGRVGADNAELCACKRGYRYTENTANAQQICEICAPGHYASEPGQADCSACLAGKFLDATGSTSQDDCTPCAAGHFAAETGTQTCTACPASEWQGDEGQNACDSCPLNTGHELTGVHDVAQCECNAGFTSRTEMGCEGCSAGKFKTERSNEDCSDCPANSNSAGSSDSLGDCTCDAGYYSTPCALDSDADCSTLQRVAAPDVERVCSLCPAGYFCNRNLDRGIQRCHDHSNSVAGSDDAQDCLCNAGYYKHESQCILCKNDAEDPPRGYFCPSMNNLAQACGHNTDTHSSKQFQPDSYEDCTCLAGYWRNCVPHQADDGSTVYMRHVDGGVLQECARDETWWLSDCFQCDEGMFCELEETMQHCPAHSTTESTGSDNVDDCFCQPGFKREDA